MQRRIVRPPRGAAILDVESLDITALSFGLPRQQATKSRTMADDPFAPDQRWLTSALPARELLSLNPEDLAFVRDKLMAALDHARWTSPR